MNIFDVLWKENSGTGDFKCGMNASEIFTISDTDGIFTTTASKVSSEQLTQNSTKHSSAPIQCEQLKIGKTWFGVMFLSFSSAKEGSGFGYKLHESTNPSMNPWLLGTRKDFVWFQQSMFGMYGTGESKH